MKERHDVTKKKSFHPDLGEVVLVVGDSKNKHTWRHGLVCQHLPGKDGVVRGVRMIVRNKIWERPVQLICPLEIRSTMTPEELNRRIEVANKVGDRGTEIQDERPTRQAKVKARKKIEDIAEDEELL